MERVQASEGPPFSVLYKTEMCNIICTIQIEPRLAESAPLEINSPGGVISVDLYKFESSSTTYKIEITNLEGGSFTDYINAIGYCTLKYSLSLKLLVASFSDVGFLVYSPFDDSICLSSLRHVCDGYSFASLRNKCLIIYNNMLSMLEV